jgi:hypothetical protein
MTQAANLTLYSVMARFWLGVCGFFTRIVGGVEGRNFTWWRGYGGGAFGLCCSSSL